MVWKEEEEEEEEEEQGEAFTKPSLSLSMQILAIRYAMRMLSGSGSARSLAMCCWMRSPSRSISLTSCRSVAVLTLWFQIMSAMGVCDFSPVNLCWGYSG